MGSFADQLDAQREAEVKAQAEADRKEKLFGQQTRAPPSPAPPERSKSAREMLDQFDCAADPGTDKQAPSPARSKDSARSMLDRFDKAAKTPTNDNAKDRQRDRGKDDDFDIGR